MTNLRWLQFKEKVMQSGFASPGRTNGHSLGNMEGDGGVVSDGSVIQCGAISLCETYNTRKT